MAAHRRASTDRIFEPIREWVALNCPGRTIGSLVIKFTDGEKASIPVPVYYSLPVEGDCEADILALLEEVAERQTTTQILGALERSGKLHGESTVKHTLSRMTREGKLTKSTDANPRGYGLPDWN